MARKKPMRKTAAASTTRRRFTTALDEPGFQVDYKDYVLLRSFMTEKGKIRARRITGLSRREQRHVALAIKRAREMALLPYADQR
jgi:small subunit ribosomal protein S18